MMKSSWKIGTLGMGLGILTWFLVPYLLPVKLPPDYPRLPDMKAASPGLRTLLEGADREARRRPASVEAMGKLAMAYHANQYFEQASSAYRIAARLAPGDYQWVYGRAYLDEETGHEKEEVELLKQTVRLKPDYLPALLKLADAYFKLDQLDQAVHYYDAGAKLPDGMLPATFGLGRVAARRQDWNRVIEILVPLSTTYSYVLPPYELLEEAYGKLGQAEKAAEARQNGARAKWRVVPPPEDPLNEQLIGVCYSSTRLLKQAGLLSRVGRPDRAMEIARRAVQVDPADPGVRNYMAYTILTFYGDQPAAVEEALTQLGECLRLKPDDLLPLWNFSLEFFKTPKQAAAVERLRGFLRPHAELAQAHYPLGMAADAEGDTAEAIAQYQAALKSSPNDSAVYNKLGQIYDRTGNFDGAIANFEKSVQLNPVNNGARLNLGIALMQRGSYGQALRELGELLQRNPHDAAAHFCMGFSYLYSKRPSEAMDSFREGLRYKPDDADAHYGLASALAALHKGSEAVAEAREALRLRPDFPAAQEILQQMQH